MTMPGGIIVKPLAFRGYIEREKAGEDTLIYTNDVTPEELKNNELIRQCPTLFQERIRKSADLRVVYLDGRIVAVKLTDHQCERPTTLRHQTPQHVRRPLSNDYTSGRGRSTNMPARCLV